jgi:hypothetical protein
MNLRNRLRSRFDKEGRSTQSSRQQEHSDPRFCVPSDTERTKDRHVEASKLLQTAMEKRNDGVGNFDFSNLTEEMEHCSSAHFGHILRGIMGTQEITIKDRTIWGKCEAAIRYIVTAFSPFAKHFLQIAADTQTA